MTVTAVALYGLLMKVLCLLSLLLTSLLLASRLSAASAVSTGIAGWPESLFKGLSLSGGFTAVYAMSVW